MRRLSASLFAVALLSSVAGGQGRKVRIEADRVEKILARPGVRSLAAFTPRGVREFTRGSALEVDDETLLAVQLTDALDWRTVGDDLECTLPVAFDRTDARDSFRSRLVLIVEGGAMVPAPEGFAGNVLVGLSAEDGRAPLPTAVRCQLVVEPGRVVPDALEIGHAGLPFERARAVAGSVEGDRVQLRVVLGFGAPLAVPIPVRRPRLDLDASPETIQGFGLQTSRITISTAPADARLLERVDVTSTHGSLKPEEVALDPRKGTGTTRLRSGGIGTAKVRVVRRGVRSDVQEVEFVLPWVFAVVALLGGLAGGLINRFRTAAGDRRPIVNALARGLLVGLVAAVAAGLGVNLLGFALPQIDLERYYSEAGAFLVAALAGIFGLFKPGEA